MFDFFKNIIDSVAHVVGQTVSPFLNGVETISFHPAEVLQQAANGTGDLVSNITEPILTGFLTSTASALTDIWNFIMYYVVGRFGPDMTWFNYYFSTEYSQLLTSFFQYAGVILASAIFVFCLVTCLANGLFDSKNTPFNLTGRFILVFFLILFGGESIPILLMDTALLVYNNLLYVEPEVSEYSFGKLLEQVGAGVIPYDKSCPSYAATSADGALTFVTAISIIGTVLMIIMLIAIIYNFIKLFIDIIRRYLVTCYLSKLFPIAVSTAVSRHTSNIASSYFRMFVGQLFLLIVNLVLLQGFMYLYISGKAFSSVIGFLFVLAYLSMAQRIDGYLSACGINMTQGAGGIIASIGGAAMTLGGLMAAGKHSAGGVGKAMMASGINSGNFDRYKMGSQLMNGMGTTHADSMDRFLSNAGHVNKSFASLGPSSQADMVSAMKQMYQNGKYLSLNGADSGARTAVAKELFEPGLKNTFGEAEGASLTNALDNVKFDQFGGLSATSSLNGMPVGLNLSSKSQTGSLGNFTTTDGKQLFASLSGRKLAAGENLNLNSKNKNLAFAANGLTDISKNGFIGNSSILTSDVAKLQGSAYGGIDLYDNTGNMVGHMTDRGQLYHNGAYNQFDCSVIEKSDGALHNLVNNYDDYDITPYDQSNASVLVSAYNATENGGESVRYIIEPAMYHLDQQGTIVDLGSEKGVYKYRKMKM